ncbi:MAG: sterol desaturase family protein [Thermoanaerobaculia bacterium]
MQLSPVEAGSFGAIAATAIALVALERIAPYNRGQALVRPGFWVDFVFYNLVQSWVLAVVIGRLIALLDAGTGLSRLALVSQWPLPAQVAFFVVTHDLYIYLMHRAQHASPFLWRFHEAHHSVPQVDWLSGVRSHPVEILVNQTIEFAPIVLLGAPPEVAPIKGAVSAIWGMFIHSNWDVRLGVLRYLLNGPETHRWHHADQPEAYGKNFATKLAVWDWLFRTACELDRGERKAERYGLGYAGFPEGYPGQVLRAFGRGPFEHETATAPARPEAT